MHKDTHYAKSNIVALAAEPSDLRAACRKASAAGLNIGRKCRSLRKLRHSIAVMTLVIKKMISRVVPDQPTIKKTDASIHMKFALVLVLLCSPLAETEARCSVVYLTQESLSLPWHAGGSDARVSGDLIYASGVIAEPDEGEEAIASFRRAFSTLQKVLLIAGGDLQDIVGVTVYQTDIDTQLPAFDAARLQFLSPPFPASTVVQVQRLIPHRAIAEIKVVARTRISNPGSSAVCVGDYEK
jgi:2-iminobutanoate/2-iminopropanoate deaminase